MPGVTEPCILWRHMQHKTWHLNRNKKGKKKRFPQLKGKFKTIEQETSCSFFSFFFLLYIHGGLCVCLTIEDAIMIVSLQRQASQHLLSGSLLLYVLCLFKCVTGEERDGNALARSYKNNCLSAECVVSLSIITSFCLAGYIHETIVYHHLTTKKNTSQETIEFSWRKCLGVTPLFFLLL